MTREAACPCVFQGEALSGDVVLIDEGMETKDIPLWRKRAHSYSNRYDFRERRRICTFQLQKFLGTWIPRTIP